MSLDLTPPEVISRIFLHITKLETAMSELSRALRKEPDIHQKLIRAEAQAWRTVEGRSREEREAYVDDQCAEQIRDYEIAQAHSKLMLKEVESLRQALSALQSAAKSVEAEAMHYRTAPIEG